MLTGEAKKDYQREYMRHRRSKEPVLDLKPIVRPKTREEAERMGKEVMGGHIPEIVLDPQLDPKQEKLTELRKVMEQTINKGTGGIPFTKSPELLSAVIPRAPLYRRGFHKKGDLVRMPGSNIETIVPELDGEFNLVPEM